MSLGLLGDKTLVPDLVAMLRDAKSLSTQAAIASVGRPNSLENDLEQRQRERQRQRSPGLGRVPNGFHPSPW
ncbi:MAG: hypothetical protein HC781_18115 [Leptolyngbyaceae cyanobacterium CSU_1_4]|nr:hypothetical protein [Leptolyngbyaceae cyanobacterium CSU_1_4]